MASFLEWLENEKKNVTNFYEPKVKVGDKNKSEKVVGELNEDLCRHWAVMHDHFKKLKKKEPVFEKINHSEISQDEFGKLIAMRRRDKVLTELFWMEVHTAFGSHAENVGIRKGFKVVTFEETEPDIFPFSGGMIIGISRL